MVNGDFESDTTAGPTPPWVPVAYDPTCSIYDVNTGYAGSNFAAELTCTNTANSYPQSPKK